MKTSIALILTPGTRDWLVKFPFIFSIFILFCGLFSTIEAHPDIEIIGDQFYHHNFPLQGGTVEFDEYAHLLHVYDVVDDNFDLRLNGDTLNFTINQAYSWPHLNPPKGPS